MKKFITATLALCLVSFSGTAMANNQAKLNTVKQLYRDALRCRNSEYGCRTDPVWSFGNESLRNAISHAHSYSYLAIDDPMHPCGDWDLGYVALVDWSQDRPDSGWKMNQFTFTPLKNGNIRANFKGYKDSVSNFGKFSVDIALTCKGSECKVSDIYNRGESFKRYLNQCHLK
ncbi:hypothetical protein [Moraxella lacunata]|uniref:Uncharacterized protein n=1 Tax=Moraxella lacunata TaxID=477 RepID=A0A1V4GPH3_MORLA|nr:hypothetical protein [Moraxella lacunata]OPH34330.1 hypothetical protein B5J94_11670 [Moraxella lacunata]